jgi:hypothetical protein
MVLQVQYSNNKYDYVNNSILQKLIVTRRIKRFYRPSEEKWVIPGIDPIRGAGGDYEGPDRRQAHPVRASALGNYDVFASEAIQEPTPTVLIPEE